MAHNASGRLAQQALELTRNKLLVSLRFMNAAFAHLKLLAQPGQTIATDGTYLRYSPADVARTFASSPEELARTYLHIMLHDVFLHPFPNPNMDAARWDAACDIAVEAVITHLALPATASPRAARQTAALAQLQAECPQLTAEALYRYFADKRLSDQELAQLAAPNHKAHRGLSLDDITEKEAPEQARGVQANRFADTVNLDRSRDQWKNAALEMGVQLDSYIKLWGVEGSNLSMNLRSVTRRQQDFTAFLRKFARMGEHVRVNDDEFDYVYYCYGLSRYGNLPLIEPLEYVEERRIRDFVIAIDTSASTKDGLVRRFLERTYSILSNETGFFTRMNVHLVQCDAAVTAVDRIHSLDELDDFLDNVQVQGLGGTDFRPVFAYVEDALERGEFQNLGGLLYFTDGQGAYPAHKPSFDTAFVFPDVETADASAPVPPWAMKAVLDETFTEQAGDLA